MLLTILFWAAAAVLAAGAAGLVIARAAKAVRVDQAAERPELPVYRRQLQELEDLRARGLLEPDAYEAARAEAGRRLLAADASGATADRPVDGRERCLALIAACAVVALALGVYLAVGSPGRPDQGHAARLAALKAVDPATLGPAEMAALLRDHVKANPKDPQAWSYLARASAAAGDAPAAVRAFEKAVRLDPRRADDWAGLGESLVGAAGGKVEPQARAAFAEALKRDPQSRPARFYLGQAAFEAGDKAEGLAQWRALAVLLPAGPGRAALERRISDLETGRTEQAAAIAAAPAEDQQAMIRGMVEGLAARLADGGGSAEDWARLIRSYGVLGDKPAQGQALATARKRFAGRPRELAVVEAAAK